MTSIIKLTTLSGVQEESALCYLLQVDEFRFLLDCGWDEHFSMDIIDSLRKHVHQIDAVLLSHPDPLHLGALPYAVGKLGLNCAIYATIPVYKMGQMFMYDLYQSRHNTEDFTLFTLDDVDAAFDKIQQLKFSQIVNLKGKGHGLSITPLPAGHMIGGTIWKIVKDGEEEIVYAVDFNHKREIHLNGCSLEMLSRPSLLITDSFNATYVQPRRKQRDEQLLTNVLETLRGDGNVLIAVDTAGRVLELAQLLDQIWRTKDAGLGVYSLALLNNVSYNVVEFSKSQVEWMSDKLMRCFEDKRNNPFQFRHLSLCHGLSDLARVPSPKVVLASQPDLECGFSRDLFIQWCQDPKNSIILTYRTTPGTLARFLIDNPSEKITEIELRKRVKLEGKELEEYLEKEKLKKEAAKKLEQSKEPEDFLVPELQATEEEKSKLESGLTNGDEPMDQDLSDVPTKCISTTESIEIKARVTYIDYEGRSDGDSIKKIINQMKPRQLIIVHGPPEASQDLAECCRAFGGKDIKVYMPKLHETVDATSETHIYQVRLKDSLVSSLQFCKAKDAELAWIDGVLDMRVSKVDTGVILEEGELKDDGEDSEMQVDAPSDSSVIAQQKAMKSLFGDDEKETGEESEIIPTLEPLPPHEVPGHQSVFMNEPRLSDFKQVLLREGIQAEFVGGVLVCNNQVAVRRTETGRIGLEGCLCQDFYRIRDLLYEQYAIV
ncbi:cleavage and polyadenylation specificity factor subunit 2 isoform X2 [Mirounga angustirostris]|uniref:Cleavage and polyadenylation specificity factor subunit 2 n=6 Tax=Caniformia TaxID=379584 RepID=A0A8I3PKR9_CANLF|nr:cleavage and polyadenylation specificity factor subunit 2 isoform X3 [Neomonachus schauinslandi]XP_027425515.1 cleavage and polyadenylation specificity factor subunit 2 isoform X2 [Zalophus californianus]XP_030892669.1 cleavage and polyadenylation specificity factor subunit 2 isoform X2 [Leptonychotes weddellii]